MQRVWASHCSEMGVLRAVFVYLDRTTVSQSQAQGASLPAAVTPSPSSSSSSSSFSPSSSSSASPLLPLWDMSVAVLREALLRRTTLVPRTVQALVAQMEVERAGETVDRGALSSSVKMLPALNLYCRSVEPALIKATEEFYRREGLAKVAELDVTLYMQLVERRIQEEVSPIAAGEVVRVTAHPHTHSLIPFHFLFFLLPLRHTTRRRAESTRTWRRQRSFRSSRLWTVT
jgi:cullin-4